MGVGRYVCGSVASCGSCRVCGGVSGYKGAWVGMCGCHCAKIYL